METEKFNRASPKYPALVSKRLGTRVPEHVALVGNSAILALPLTALFCSARCPGRAILRIYDQDAKWRAAGRCVINGFHSPVEKKCFRILLRQGQFVKAIWRTGGFWLRLLGEGWFDLMGYRPAGWVLPEREKPGTNGLLSRREPMSTIGRDG